MRADDCPFILSARSTAFACGSAVLRIYIRTQTKYFDVLLTVHHSIDLFHLPALMHNSFIH